MWRMVATSLFSHLKSPLFSSLPSFPQTCLLYNPPLLVFSIQDTCCSFLFLPFSITFHSLVWSAYNYLPPNPSFTSFLSHFFPFSLHSFPLPFSLLPLFHSFLTIAVIPNVFLEAIIIWILILDMIQLLKVFLSRFTFFYLFYFILFYLVVGGGGANIAYFFFNYNKSSLPICF